MIAAATMVATACGVTSALSPASLSRIEQALVSTNDVLLTLPKFDITPSLDLKPILSATATAAPMMEELGGASGPV